MLQHDSVPLPHWDNSYARTGGVAAGNQWRDNWCGGWNGRFAEDGGFRACAGEWWLDCGFGIRGGELLLLLLLLLLLRRQRWRCRGDSLRFRSRGRGERVFWSVSAIENMNVDGNEWMGWECYVFEDRRLDVWSIADWGERVERVVVRLFLPRKIAIAIAIEML